LTDIEVLVEGPNAPYLFEYSLRDFIVGEFNTTSVKGGENLRLKYLNPKILIDEFGNGIGNPETSKVNLKRIEYESAAQKTVFDISTITSMLMMALGVILNFGM